MQQTTPNLVWKRGNNKIKRDFGIAAYYAYYKKCSSKDKKCIDRNTYSNILRDYFNAMTYDMARYGREFLLPNRLGSISFTMFKRALRLNEEGELDKRYLAVDWAETKRLWAEDPEMFEQKKRIFHLNEHTEGYTYKLLWKKPCHRRCKNINLYSFKGLRSVTKLPSQLLKQGCKLSYNSISNK